MYYLTIVYFFVYIVYFLLSAVFMCINYFLLSFLYNIRKNTTDIHKHRQVSSHAVKQAGIHAGRQAVTYRQAQADTTERQTDAERQAGTGRHIIRQADRQTHTGRQK